MKSKQRGATLLEAILAAAVIGWVLAYAGSQLMKTAKERELNQAANKIVSLQYVIKQFTSSIYLLTDKESPLDKVVNPMLSEANIGSKIYFDSDLKWLKRQDCAESGDVPKEVTRTYINCGYNADVFSLSYFGSLFDFKRYDNLAYPKAKRIPVEAWSIYIADTNNFTDFYDVVSRITTQELDGGFRINNESIEIGEISVDGKDIKWINEPLSLATLMNEPIEKLDKFITRMTNSKHKFGLRIKIYYEHEMFLKRDGTVPIALGASLCWDSASSSSRPCISLNSSLSAPEKDHLVVDSGLVFGKEKKRTPVIVDYNSFGSSGDPVKIKAINCPNGDRWKNKFVAINSSFSSGSDTGTDFSDPSMIKSTGTAGANGKHAFLSGLSLEWNESNDGGIKNWLVKGAIAIDSAYAKDNGNSSVLRNPKSMSFITMQWCEEE